MATIERGRQLMNLMLLAPIVLGCSGPDEQPSVSVSAPDSTRLHDVVPLTAVAQDNDGVAGVLFRVDGGPLGDEDTQAPFAVDWDTHQHANGAHVISAVARDSAGNATTSTPLAVTVSNAVPLGDRIVVSSYGPTGQQADIYAMNGDGTGLERLTFTDDLYETDPSVSPDGQRIAFTRQLADGNVEIFAMNAAGGGEVNLTNDPATDGHPAWSPDGTRIAFSTQGQIYLMNSDGSGRAPVTAVTDGAADEAAWSPDGSVIAFTHSTDIGQIGIAVIQADGTGFKDLTLPGPDNGPAWSPDGSRIAFTRYDEVSLGHIHLMNADGSNIQGIFTAPDTSDSYPVWSRDGTHLVIERNFDVQTNRDIWVMNLDGGGAFSVLSLPGTEAAPDVAP